MLNLTHKQEAMSLLMGAAFSEDYLEARFGRLPKAPQKITYEFTTDVGLLHQYHLLRDVAKDASDAMSEVVVARIGNHCIAGCRMLKHGDTIEISLPAILPEFEGGVIVTELLRSLLQRGIEMQARVANFIAPAPLARQYRNAAELFGLAWEKQGIVDAGDYEGSLACYRLDLTAAQKVRVHIARELQPVA